MNDQPTAALSVLPMAHVADLRTSIDFYEQLGGTLGWGSRDGDWAMMKFGATQLSLLARSPSIDNPEPVELQFMSRAPLERLAGKLRSEAPRMIERGISDEAFGRMLRLRTAEGLIVKVLELERDLIA